MAIKYVFNPFTGTLDTIDDASAGIDISKLQSAAGAYAVDTGVAVGELVYVTGSFAADEADNSSISTGPAVGLVTSKPTTTTATVAFAGEVNVLSGLTAGSDYFMGTAGSVILAGALPTASGSVVQKLGVAVTTTILLLNIQLPVVL